MFDSVNEYIKQMMKGVNEETDEAIKALMSIAGIEVYGEEKDLSPQEAFEQLKEKGMRIARFNLNGETFFILHKEGKYVAGSVITITNVGNKVSVKRTMIPHDSKIREKAKKLIEGMNK